MANQIEKIKDEDLVVEIEDKHRLSEDYRTSNDFEGNLKVWKDYYEGTSKETRDREAAGRAALLPPWPATIVDHLLARYVLSIFGAKPYFSCAPLKKESENASKINQDLLIWQLERPSIFYNIVKFIQSILVYGFSVFKTGWDFETDNIILKNWDIKKFHYNPNASDLTHLRWGIFDSWRLLDELKAENASFEARYKKPLYENLDKVEKGVAIIAKDESGKYTEEEKRGLIKLWEYWDKDKKILIANEKEVILKTPNPIGFVPAVCSSDTPKLEGILGTGEVEAIEDYERELATIKCQRMDNVNLALNPAWLRNINVEILNEEDLHNLRPGTQINVDVEQTTDIATVLRAIEIPPVTANAYNEASILEKNIQDRTGSYGPIRGERSTVRETATGLSRLQSMGSILFRFKIVLSMKTAFTLLLSQVTAWNQEYLPNKTIILVRGTERGIPEFRKVSRKSIQGDFQFIEQISAVDPEASKDFKRAQLLEALRILLQLAPLLPNLNIEELTTKVLESFDIPGLEDVITKMPAGMPGGLPGGGRGTPAVPGASPGAAAAGEGKAAGGLMGKALGALGGR